LPLLAGKVHGAILCMAHSVRSNFMVAAKDTY
jgi:hypothetical protein